MTLEWFPALACVASLVLKYFFADANKKREAILQFEKGELRNAEKRLSLALQNVKFLEIELKQTGVKSKTIQKNLSLLEQALEGFLEKERAEEEARLTQQMLLEKSRRIRQKGQER